MTQYRAGQMVEISTGGWDGDAGWSKGDRITLIEHIPEGASFGGEWRADDRNGTRGIIAEKNFKPVSEGPVRTETVTTRRIVPGVYGRLRVVLAEENDEYGGVCLQLINRAGRDHGEADLALMTSTELDDLAMVASQLAEALRDGMD